MKSSSPNDNISVFSTLTISHDEGPNPNRMVKYNDSMNEVVRIGNRIYEATTSIGNQFITIKIILLYLCLF